MKHLLALLAPLALGLALVIASALAAADTGAITVAASLPAKADVAWLMVATALVIMMAIPDLALFYGGLVRSNNMLPVLMQVFVTFSMIVVLWCLYGYSRAFSSGSAGSASTPALR